MIAFQGFPSLDLEQGAFRAWWFEPFQATVCWGLFINFYWYYERKHGFSSAKNFRDTIYLDEGPLFSSGVAYWIGIYLWKCLVPPASHNSSDGIPSTWLELVYLMAELVTGIVLYDSIFFFIHWAMHDLFILRTIHKRHHQRPDGTVESRDVLRHSILDGSLQVLINIIVQRTTPWGTAKSRLARLLHNFVVIWMLTESHCASPSPNIWRRWFVGVREHRLHHLGKPTRLGLHHRHQQFFGYLDNLRAFMESLE